MKTNVQCVSPQTSAQQAALQMREQNVGFLPVCDEAMRAIGTVTDRDIAVRIVADGKRFNTPVEQFLSADVVCCRPEDDLSYARELMSQSHVSRIICTDRTGRIDGVISLSDIVQCDEHLGAVILREVSSREVHG